MELITASLMCAIIAIFIFKIIVRVGGPESIPGPKFSFPILGHLPLLGKEPWIKFMQWKKLYGPIFAIQMGIYDVIVLGESKLIKEAFSRPEFSGRPPFEVFQSASRGKGIGLNDGPLVAEQRNFALKCLRGNCFRTNLLEESIHLELNAVLKDIEKKCGRPVAVKGMFAVHVMNAIWNIYMGNGFDHDDPQLPLICHAVEQMGRDDGLLAALSMFLPAISKLMPELSGRKQKLEAFTHVHNFIQKAFDEPIPPTRAFDGPGNFKEAFMDEMERAEGNLASSFHPTHNNVLYSAADIFAASMETTSATLDWLLLYMAKHPKVQKKTQVEIDEKIGNTRRPLTCNKENTPYVQAVVQEILRLSSVFPLAFIHRATEDAELRGYKIKKDTLVIANQYGVHYDEDVWGDPENFRPERFFDDSGNLDRHPMRHLLPFGTGKRSCIGENLARDQIYLFCTSIFQQFNVSCDEDISFGNSVGIIRGPKEFKLTFTKRFTD